MAQNTDSPLVKRKNTELSPDNAENNNPVGSMSIRVLMNLMSSLMDDKLKNSPTKAVLDDIKVKVKAR